MDPNYNDDQRYLQQLQNPPMQPIQPASTGGIWNYIRNNKVTVIIIVLVIAALLWWFCFRNKNTGTDLTITPTTRPNTINVTRTRVPTLY